MDQGESEGGQFHGAAVPSRAEPARRAAEGHFGVPGGSPNFSYDSRLSDKGMAWLSSVRSNVTYLRGSHSFKTGIYYEKLFNSEGKGGVGGGAWAGDYNFTSTARTPSTPTTPTRMRCWATSRHTPRPTASPT